MASDRLIAEEPDAAAGAIRAVVKTQQALKAIPPSRRRSVALFPPLEAELIAELIDARRSVLRADDHPEDKVLRMTQFAQAIGRFRRPVPYEQVVATQFSHLWRG